MIAPEKLIEALLAYPFYGTKVPLAIGNETDMFHPFNVDYLIKLLDALARATIPNPIVLITKAPLSARNLQSIRAINRIRLVLFLSYSGLGKRYEPNFSDEQLKGNFVLAKEHGFSVVHFWRPLLPENTGTEAIRQMLEFVSPLADASVCVGLKLHPDLTRVIADGIHLDVPVALRGRHGEWLDPEVVSRIHCEAEKVCPSYRVYRHSSCAIASILSRPNHTATVFRQDICNPSQCPAHQRRICEGSRRIPTKSEIERVVCALGRSLSFEIETDCVVFNDEVNQEEFAFLLHGLNCPLLVNGIRMQNLYHGDIYAGQRKRLD